MDGNDNCICIWTDHICSQRLPVVDRDSGQGRVLLPVEGVRWRQALALVLGGRVVGQGLVVARSHVLRLECGDATNEELGCAGSKPGGS
ncbi:MAG: hypothetical protein FRX49_02428 [Trebouxia sp. A1-2]|nr:MAG: hypothetical protein FRX49_02428 [Trebouxia sp. A1-2]